MDDPTAHPGISLVCLHCLLDDGAADLTDDGQWVGRTLDDEKPDGS